MELWIGLIVFGVLAYFIMRGGESSKKMQGRLARVTRRGGMAVRSAGPGSLRRRKPEETAFGQFLLNFSSIEKLQQRLAIAGMTTRPQKFIAIALAVAFVTFAFILMLGKPVMLAILMGLLTGLGIPHFLVSRKIKKRKLSFLKLFPEAIDLIVRGLRAGLPVAEAFQTIAKEIPAPVGDTFAIITQQIGLGVPMERALTDTAKRLNMTEFNFFVTTIILQRETGGNLGEILSNLSEVLRARQMMKLKIGALSSEARASAMIVGALPFVVFMLLQLIAPKYLRPLFDDYRGNMALIGAGVSLLFGAVVMKRMTQLEI